MGKFLCFFAISLDSFGGKFYHVISLVKFWWESFCASLQFHWIALVGNFTLQFHWLVLVGKFWWEIWWEFYLAIWLDSFGGKFYPVISLVKYWWGGGRFIFSFDGKAFMCNFSG